MKKVEKSRDEILIIPANTFGPKSITLGSICQDPFITAKKKKRRLTPGREGLNYSGIVLFSLRAVNISLLNFP
jgi:hypothetical protein